MSGTGDGHWRHPDLPPGTWVRLVDFGRAVVPIAFRISLRLRVHHRERVPAAGPVVLVANHSSLLDGPVIGVVLGRRPVFLIKREMFRGPLGPLLSRLGQLAVRRGAPDRAPLLTAVRVLRGGGLVGIFPEGTRGAGDVDEARNGAVWLARSAGAVLLPVACRGTFRPPGARRRWRPRVDVLVGEPLPVPTDRGRAALAAGTERVRVALADLVSELDRIRAGGAPGRPERKVENT